MRLKALATILGVLACGCRGDRAAESPESIAPRQDYAQVAESLTPWIQYEMEDKELPAVSIALVDDQEIVWARGFGMADPEKEIEATADTIYRVGSVSKLFTDLAVMQLVEQGRVDLDAPVSSYLPDFAPENPYDVPITLRQLMSHRSGLIREPPAGHYFDVSGTSLDATVASLNGTTLVAEPGSETKYSNAGIAVAGAVVEKVTGLPFPEALESAVLHPIGMERSGFTPTEAIRRDLAHAIMWTYDGRTFEAPHFELGMRPAGSMYSPVVELGRFLSVLFAGGEASGGRVISEASLREMWTPQFSSEAPGEAPTGFGIGFGLGGLDGARWVGHGGAIYGFATQLAALPDEKLGVVVVTTVDIANTVTGRIADMALRMMRAARTGSPLPEPERTAPIPPQQAQRLEGRYEGDGTAVTLQLLGGELHLQRDSGGFRERLRALDGALVADGRQSYGTRVLPVDGAIEIDGDRLERVPEPRPDPPPAHWEGLIGEYGWDHNTLYILEHGGRLHALIEWFFQYPLEEVSEDVYAFPDEGLYEREQLVFERGPDGSAVRVSMNGLEFPRREVGTPAGETYRIEPLKPVEELREPAMSANPPVEEGEFRKPDLVELQALDPTVLYDIRYATTNNFMGAVFYRTPHAFLQRPAAEALVRAQRRLEKYGFGLLIHDAYRPWFVTEMFFDATPEEQRIFVADPAQGSRHNRGAAVDLTLYELDTGEPVTMVGGYDEFSPRSFPDYPGGTSRQRWRRELLRDAMEAEGFTVYEWEWWHFDYGGWREFPIGNRSFEEILAESP
ncbi:MAG: serine hydrolase [Thermoanaerobaculia bacterium]